jgi:hypothetical protein
MRYRNLLLSFVIAAACHGQTVTWQKRFPNAPPVTMYGIGWNNLQYDSASQQTVFPTAPGNYTGIYSTHWFFYKASSGSNGTLTDWGGTASTIDACPASFTAPRDRHPDGNTPIDQVHHRLWVFSGVNVNCADNPLHDLYYMNLNANPASNAWTRVIPSTWPNTVGDGVTVYDDDDDVLINYGVNLGGVPQLWVFCFSNGSGTTTTLQNAAGCGATADNWVSLTSSISTWPTFNAGAYYVSHELAGAAYDNVTHRMIIYGGSNGALNAYSNLVWAYAPATKTWTQKCTSCPAPPVYSGGTGTGQQEIGSFTYSIAEHKFYYMHGSWSGTPQLYKYDPSGDTWATVASSGLDATIGFKLDAMAVDVSTSRLILWTDNTANNNEEVWEGQLPLTTTSGQFRSLAVWPSGNLKHVEGCGVLASLTAGATASVTVNGLTGASFSIQEELYPGDQTGSTYSGLTGVARTNEPFCTDIPIADAAAITSVSSLSFSGTASVSTTSMATDNQDCTGASNNNFLCVNTGAAKFQIRKASTNIIDAVTVGATTVVSSGTAATRGLILTGPDPSLSYPGNTTCAGGAGCNTQYSSANDGASTCTLTVNGPVKVLVRCNGSLIDGASHYYQHYTTYSTFYAGETYALVEVALRNADYGASTGTFETATKQIGAWELRIPLSGSPTTFTIPSYTGDANCSSATCTGTIAGASGAYLYQGYSNFLKDYSLGSGGGWTVDTGFTIQNNAAQITSGTASQTPVGVADCANGSGVGAAVGIPNMGAEWPSSVECVSSDARIGFYSTHNGVISSTVSHPYMPWPQWVIHKGFVEFHSSAPASVKNDFLKAQLHLVGRPSVSYFNSTGVEVYPLPTATESDNLSLAAYSAAIQTSGHPTTTDFCPSGAAPCMIDFNNQINSNYNLADYRFWGWSNPGGQTQLDNRRANALNFISRGYTGRFLDSEFFWRYEAQNAWPHSDGGSQTDSAVNNYRWMDKTGLDTLGRPAAYTSANQGTWYSSVSPVSGPEWWDNIHLWWSSILNGYFLTGDELLKESFVSIKSWYLNSSTAPNGASSVGITRGNAAHMLTGAMFSEYLASIGDLDSTGVLNSAKGVFTNTVQPDLCVKDGNSNVWPAGCTMPGLNVSSGSDPSGVSRVRGSVGVSTQRYANWSYCNNGAWAGTGSVGIRADVPYFNSMLVDALITLQRVAGTSYAYYWTINDLLYGIAQNSLGLFGFSDDGSAHWWTASNTAPSGPVNALFNGWRYSPPIDLAYQCPGGTTPAIGNGPPQFDVESFASGGVWDLNVLAGGTTAGTRGSIYGAFLGAIHNNGALTADQLRKLYISMQWQAIENGQNTVDLYSYQLGALAHYIPSSTLQLQDLSFSLQDLGGGNYHVTATVPAGSTAVRIKYSPKVIANSGGFSSTSPSATDGMLGYDPVVTQVFSLNPSTYATWFGATDATPASFVVGANTFNVSTGTAGMVANQFSVKAMVPASGPAANGAAIFSGGLFSGAVVIH